MIKEGTEESKYIQQHLANERTYLAWVRTSIALIGIGFLASSLHFNNVRISNNTADAIAIFVSLFSLFIGVFILIFATINYFYARKSINTQTFSSTNFLIKISSVIILIIFFLLIMYTWSVM